MIVLDVMSGTFANTIAERRCVPSTVLRQRSKSILHIDDRTSLYAQVTSLTDTNTLCPPVRWVFDEKTAVLLKSSLRLRPCLRLMVGRVGYLWLAWHRAL